MMALDAAAAFDASGKRDIAEFLHSLDCMEAKSSSIRKTVQFMTIYKSKGLDFDLVIVPELYTNNGIDTGSRELIVKKDAAFRPEWVTHAPRKAFLPFFPAVAEADAVLNEDNTYENCCLLYVAMTRARHALYLMIPDEKGGRKLLPVSRSAPRHAGGNSGSGTCPMAEQRACRTENDASLFRRRSFLAGEEKFRSRFPCSVPDPCGRTSFCVGDWLSCAEGSAGSAAGTVGRLVAVRRGRKGERRGSGHILRRGGGGDGVVDSRPVRKGGVP